MITKGYDAVHGNFVSKVKVTEVQKYIGSGWYRVHCLLVDDFTQETIPGSERILYINIQE